MQKAVTDVCDSVISYEYNIQVELTKKHSVNLKELEREIAYFRAITGIDGPIISADGKLLEHKVDLSHDPEFMKMLQMGVKSSFLNKKHSEQSQRSHSNRSVAASNRSNSARVPVVADSDQSPNETPSDPKNPT